MSGVLFHALAVITGLVPVIHAGPHAQCPSVKLCSAWMAGTRPAMTLKRFTSVESDI